MIDTIAIIADDRIERMTMFHADSRFFCSRLTQDRGREISTHVAASRERAVAMARIGLDLRSSSSARTSARTVLAHLLQEGVSRAGPARRRPGCPSRCRP
jgi:hypothetical protein